MLRRRSNAPLDRLPLHNANSNPYLQEESKKKRGVGAGAISIGQITTARVALIVLCILGTCIFFVKRGNPRLYRYGRDRDRHCTTWAKQGDCNRSSTRPNMLAECPMSCLSIADVSVDSLEGTPAILEDAANGFAYFVHDPTTLEDGKDDCIDVSENCPIMAQENKCMTNASFMQSHCRKSCLVCFGTERTTVTIDFGVEQEMGLHDDDEDAADEALDKEKIVKVIESTRDYMVSEVFGNSNNNNNDDDNDYLAVRRDCRNLDPHCSIYAAAGECHGTNDALAMFQNCAPACHACNALEYYHKCARRPDDEDILLETTSIGGDISNSNSDKEGLNQVFERIVSTYQQDKQNSSVVVLSQPNKDGVAHPSSDGDKQVALPWIVILEDLLSEDECDWLIAKGHEQGFRQTSEISDELQEDGTFANKIGQGRTSMDSWCQRGCEDQPVGKAFMERMTNMTGIPIAYTEYAEILKYETGGHYERHHDVISTQGQTRCGNRILTLYVFLSDVKDGGELRFTDLDIEVTPKKGRAILWQNVPADGFSYMHPQAFHEAMPVKEGQKYGLNLWFHSRNIREALADGCC